MNFPLMSLLSEVHPLVFFPKEDLTLYMFKNVFLIIEIVDMAQTLQGKVGREEK